MGKKYIILAVSLVLIFSFFYYKNQKLGNNIIKLSEEKIIEDILSSKLKYDAKIKVKVYSNKNENEYNLKIKEDGKNNYLEVTGNKDVSSLLIENKNGNLVIKNSKLKLEKLYENYREFTDNSLFLSTFVEEYEKAKEKEIIEENGEIVIKIELKNYNKYIKYKELYLDKKTGKPVKLLVKDSSKQEKLSIKYINIEIS